MTPTETATILRHYNAWRRGNLEDQPMPDPREIGLAIDAAVEMIESAEEERALCDKLADILTRTANVLKGEPKPLYRHSWHDLPEVAQRLVAAPSAQPAPSVPECPYPCGWRNLLKLAIKDGAYLARSVNEDEPVTENARAVTMRMVMRLRDVLMALNNAAPESKP